MNHEALPIPELVAVVIGLLLFAATTKGFADRYRLPFTVTLVLVGIALKELGEIGPAGITDGWELHRDRASFLKSFGLRPQ